MKTDRWISLLIGLAVAGTLMILLHTRFGPGSSGDSTSYLMGAENLLAGRGYARYSGGYESVPITGFPPGYSALIALAGTTGLDLWALARWLNAALFGVNIFLSGYLVVRFSGSYLAGALASAVVLLYDVQVELHSWIMSEPLYTALMLLATIVILRHLRTGSWPQLILASLLMAAATLTRYVGASLLAGGVITLLVLGRTSVRKRLVQVVVMIAVAAAPVALWLRRNAFVADTIVNRELNLHSIRPELLRLYAAEATSWIIPHEVPLPTVMRALLALTILGSIVIIFLWFYARREVSWDRNAKRVVLETADDRWPGIIWFLAVTNAAYLAILAANSLFLDAATTPAAPPRYLAPFFVASVVLLVGAGAWLIRSINPGRVVRSLVGLYVVVLLGFFLWNTGALLSDPLSNLGYTGYRYRWSGVRSELESIPGDAPIISNNPEIVYALIERPAYARPIRFDPYQQEERQDLETQFEQAQARMKSGGVLVIFKPVEEIDRTVIEELGLVLLENYPQANFYGLPEGALKGSLAARGAGGLHGGEMDRIGSRGSVH